MNENLSRPVFEFDFVLILVLFPVLLLAKLVFNESETPKENQISNLVSVQVPKLQENLAGFGSKRRPACNLHTNLALRELFSYLRGLLLFGLLCFFNKLSFRRLFSRASPVIAACFQAYLDGAAQTAQLLHLLKLEL